MRYFAYAHADALRRFRLLERHAYYAVVFRRYSAFILSCVTFSAAAPSRRYYYRDTIRAAVDVYAHAFCYLLSMPLFFTRYFDAASCSIRFLMLAFRFSPLHYHDSCRRCHTILCSFRHYAADGYYALPIHAAGA